MRHAVQLHMGNILLKMHVHLLDALAQSTRQQPLLVEMDVTVPDGPLSEAQVARASWATWQSWLRLLVKSKTLVRDSTAKGMTILNPRLCVYVRVCSGVRV